MARGRKTAVSGEKPTGLSSEDSKEIANATRSELMRLNGLILREFSRRIESGEATSQDLTAAVRFVTYNRVEAEDDTRLDPVKLRAQIGEQEFPFPFGSSQSDSLGGEGE